ncbi:MAG: hypothetical protein V5A43_03045 [Haloarculaceae archaeon]
MSAHIRAGTAPLAVLGALLLVAPVAGPALAGVGALPAQSDVDPDTVLMDVALEADGDAVWTVSYRVRLDDENATAAFESVAAEIEADPETYSAPFERRMARTVAAAANATGREMSLRNLTVSTREESLPQATGVVVYRFEWVGFAAVADGTIEAGDAIDQLYLDGDTRLAISWPADYHRTSVAPPTTRAEPTEVVWAGERSFDPGEPRVTVAPGAAGGDGGDEGDDGSGGPLEGLAPLLMAAVLGGLVLVALWVVGRRRGWPLPGSGGDEGAGTAPGADASGPSTGTGGEAARGRGPASATEAGPASGQAGQASGGQAGQARAPAGELAGGEDQPPPDLLSNEERVLGLLREAGGRMKQQQVAEELDWTAAKTSQVVGDMRDAGDLESFRVGRENVLRLPEVGGDALGAPSEEREAEGAPAGEPDEDDAER